MGFGSNEDGQLGLELKKQSNYINEIKVIKLLIYNPTTRTNFNNFDIWDIAAGDNFSLILISANNRAFLVRLGINPEDKYKDDLEKINPVNLVEMDYDKINTINKVYVFGQRSIIITANNDIYVGGIDFNLNPLEKYKFVDHFSRQIKNIYLGIEHCFILDCKK